jgi:hypothetical protein
LGTDGLDRLRQRDVTDQHRRQTRSEGNVEDLLHARPAQVAAHDDDPVARLREGDGQVDRHQRLAFARRRAGDLDDPNLALDAQELHRRSQRPEGFGRRRGRVTDRDQLCRRGADLRDQAQRRHAGDLVDHLLRLHRVVEVVADEGQRRPEEEAEHQADGDVERHIGTDRSVGGAGGAQHLGAPAGRQLDTGVEIAQPGSEVGRLRG